MTFEELQQLAEKDLKINDTELDLESLKTPALHNKYSKYHDTKKYGIKRNKQADGIIQYNWFSIGPNQAAPKVTWRKRDNPPLVKIFAVGKSSEYACPKDSNKIVCNSQARGIPRIVEAEFVNVVYFMTFNFPKPKYRK